MAPSTTDKPPENYGRYAQADDIALKINVLIRNRRDEGKDPGCGCSTPPGNYPTPAEVLAAVLEGMEAAGL